MPELGQKACSGIILAGGRSRRMGCNKADLLLDGRTLLQHQIQKLKNIGIEDILISGECRTVCSGARVIPDEFRDRGPLGGMHACLKAARNSCCLVISVDAPLVPETLLARLRKTHASGVTVLRHGDKVEPLVGVYDCSLAPAIEGLIAGGGASVRSLARCANWTEMPYEGAEELLLNCNTPEEFAKAVNLYSAAPQERAV